ncbi:FG-GAP repeat domain-containing protein [Streptomyces sp. KS_5]|uniref:FG-GAP repeat domain-containing protein n=1 Tax=Streptomyces sp. KS_5 TaxID=1881018 RepID=UPI00089553FA|nr:VCBS repeat-containing protein [Streptomyces sp. KS_5]SEC99128.1 Repeat domain-containing protein [Streptomyces sp. KS_5]
MARHAFVRLVTASSVIVAGFAPLLPTTAVADTPQETVVPATPRSSHLWATLHQSDTLYGTDAVGAEGVYHRLEGSSHLLWTRYSDGRSVEVPSVPGGNPLGTGSDILAYRHDGGRIDLWSPVDGSTRTFRTPTGHTVLGVYGTTVVTWSPVTHADGTTSRVHHLLEVGPDGTVVDTEVGGIPEGMSLGTPRGADVSGVVFNAVLDDGWRVVAVDRHTGRVQSWSGSLPSSRYAYLKLSPEHVAVYSRELDSKVLVLSRTDLSAAPVEVDLEENRSDSSVSDLAVVGDWLVSLPVTGDHVTAKPIAGGAEVRLFTAARRDVATASDGSAVAVGGTGDGDWGIQRIHADASGRPVVTRLKALPKPPSPVQGISLDQGRLVVADSSWNGQRDDYVRTVAVTGAPEFGERSDFTPRQDSSVVINACPAQDITCSRVFGTADGRIVWLEHGSEAEVLRVNGPTDAGFWQRGVPADGIVTDVSGQYVLYATPGATYVYRIGDSGAAVARTSGAAALSGDVLWTPATAPGAVTALNLSTKNSSTVTTDAGCKPVELQALGRYLYWNCESRAGVYDRTLKKSVAVPTGEAKLGDGYVVTHDKQAGKLTMTAVAGGTAVDRVIGDLPDTASQRDVRWTVDESGANAAYVDTEQRVHLVPSGVPQQPMRLLGPARNVASVEAGATDAVPDTVTTVLLSKPSAGWELTVRNKAGKVVGTANGGAARGELSVGWDGDDPTRTGDAFLPSGSYDWTLSVTPADGAGAPLEVRGSVTLLHGDPVRHDHAGPDGLPDGTGDLLTLNSSGTLTFQQGTGKGTFSGKVSGSGWSTKAVAVPFGDLNRDRCNDVLVRMSDGSLRGYKVKCGLAPATSMSYTKLGTGWNAYDVLTSPGDLTGDKRPDLLARKASTGDVYLFAAKSDGTLADGKKIRSAWTGYTKIVGAGDLNGDGHGDVLARDKAGTLWRYNGLGNGLLKDRVKVFGGWGSGYDVIVGPGDITGDGKADLVSRDGSGNVWRNNGDGKGSFGARVKIAGGWQGYKGIF